MKQLHRIGVAFGLFVLSVTAVVAKDNAVTDKLNFAGSYNCIAYDSHNGLTTDGVVTFTLDEQASDPEHNFGAYRFKSKEYNGYIAAQGTQYAFYFESNDHKDPLAISDHGIGIANINYSQDKNGKFSISLYGTYYQPDFLRNAKDGKGPGGRGTSVCTKL